MLGKILCSRYYFVVQRTVKQFSSFAEAERADREFYKKLMGNERLNILLELLKTSQGDGKIDRTFYRVRKLGDPSID